MNERSDATFDEQHSLYEDPLAHLSDEEFWALAASAANSTTSHPLPAEYLLCMCGTERCAISLASLGEIVQPREHFTRLPAAPPWMYGIVMWRGEMIAVIDLDAYLLNKTALPRSERTDEILLVAQSDKLVLGLLVARIESTTTLEKEPILPLDQSSAWGSPLRANAIAGVYGRRTETLILDIPAILIDVEQQIRMIIPYE
ncbi:chemotaxis protein CheW [Ktedonosporobacter rubrisoli]|uniref:Chemotaxis protein CheW n=1 Tax=Ktedonosporobacter rubrisoli TaxID=2509675 RepID=A0A4P6JYH3_KTERU|nr:chemotaxis protein CheW [Ktedonosporobacter rubrisoli]QBD80523.1 chemotaxis protein CheW [Ktedonosporobacter rubrisoli]